VARKADLGYIIRDEQITKCRLAQAPEEGQEAEGTEESGTEGKKVASKKS
jgi:hypothetical protein